MTKDKFEFVESLKINLKYLIKDYGFELLEKQQDANVAGKTILDSLTYINNSNQLLIEIIIYTSFYNTGIESHVRGIYLKKLSGEGLVPNYNEKGKCYIIPDIKRIIPQKKGFLSKRTLEEPFIEQTISGEIWPDSEDEDTYKYFTRHTGPAYIETFKEKIKEIFDNGYEIVYDESELPPYEQSFLNPSIEFKHELTGVKVRVNFQARDQEFYVDSNARNITSYERACDSTFEKLKKQMIDAINKSA